MAISEAALCNLALARIGVSVAIESLAEQSEAANLCNALYPQARDAVLREPIDWGFATGWRTLAAVTNPSPDWTYAYRYPVDALRVRRLSTGDRTTTPPPFTRGRDAAGRLLLTDQGEAVAEITCRITDPTEFDTLFDSALAWRLAMEIAPALSRVKGMVETARGMYSYELGAAAAADGSEAARDTDPEAESIRVRE